MFSIIFMTCPNKKIADKIVFILLRKRLVACANVLSIKSSYWWKGKIERNSEVLVIMKTKTKLFDLVKKEIKSIHPYEIPEIISLKIDKGSNNYLNWIREVVK